MKAFTINLPWAWAIFRVGKDIENRTWRTHYRGPLLIHAGQSAAWYKDVSEWWPDETRPPELPLLPLPRLPPLADLPRSAIVGVVDLVDCIAADDYEGDSMWCGDDAYYWLLARPRIFEEPIPYKGSLSIWNVPDEVVAEALLKARPTTP